MEIVYVGSKGFPLGFAQVERQKLISKGLIACGCNVTVISRYGIHEKGQSAGLLESNIFEGIKFFYASGSPYKENNFLNRNVLKLRGLLKEMSYLFGKRKKINSIIISTNTFYNVLFYGLLSSLFGIPSVLDNVENLTFQSEKKSLFIRIDASLYDSYAFKCVNKVICISNYLLNIVIEKAPRKPAIKIPVIVDFSKFQKPELKSESFFLFCGGAIYFEVIDFIISSYEQLDRTNYKLYIVSNGTSLQEEKVKERISNSCKKDFIKFHSKLDYGYLTQLYKSSKALLIPVRNTEQDIARFPHKIGEYCASGKAIITTKYGEIANYFSDNINALIADDYDVKLFSEKMKYAVDNSDTIEKMGGKSYLLGKGNFDYMILGKKIFDFIL